MSDEGHRFLQTWLPVAQAGGPFLTVGLAIVLCVSLWWINGWLNECVERNRIMATQLVSQQKEFHTEVMLRLERCPPRP